MWNFLVLAVIAALPEVLCQDKTYNFPEEEKEGSFVGNIARDLLLADVISPGVYQTLQYSIMAWEDGAQFRVDKDNSDLFTKYRLDREQLCRFKSQCLLNLRVVARSNTDIRRYWIVVNLLDINDNAPTFSNSSVNLTISESVTVGMKYSIPSASDDDRGEGNTIQSYSIEPKSDYFGVEYLKKLDGTFDVNLVVSQLLDREKEDTYRLVLVARDGGTPARSGSMTINIKISDVNDNAPRFPQSEYKVNVGENTSPGAVILTLQAFDDDIGVNAAVTYRLSRNQDVGITELFAIDPVSGVLTARSALTSGSYTIIVEAVDGGTPRYVNQTRVQVTVIDTENNPPVISVDPLNGDSDSAFISESAAHDSIVAYVSVSDPDSNENGVVTCYSQSSFFDLRRLQDDDYMVVVVRPLDREETSEYTVTIFCEDAGTPKLSATKSFHVAVGDVNDNAPVFDLPSQVIHISEDNSVNDVAMLLSATDKDEGDNAKISYSLLNDSNGFFRIPPGSNALVCAKILDRETQDTHVLKILARDGGTPSLTATATVTVSVLDINDFTPQFFQMNYKFFISEGLAAGSVVGTVSAYDLDLNESGEIRFSIPASSPVSEKFHIHSNGTITTLVPLDRETTEVYQFPVRASDLGRPPLASQVDVQVTVSDVNDNAPIFLFPSATNNSLALTLPVDDSRGMIRLQASDADVGQNGEFYFTLQPGNVSDLFKVNSVTGDLFAARTFEDEDVGDYNLTFTVTDKGNPPLSSSRFLLIHFQLNPKLTPVHNSDVNAMIAGGLVCGTVLVAVAVVLAVCFVRRRDKGKQLRYLDSKRANSTQPRIAEDANASKAQNAQKIQSSTTDGPNKKSGKSKTYISYQNEDNPADRYSRPVHAGVRLAVDMMVKGDEPDNTDKELNRVTSLRLQQAFQHISSFKTQLLTPADTIRAYEWREIHIPSHPGDFSSLSSRGTMSTTVTNLNSCTGDSGIATDDEVRHMRKVRSSVAGSSSRGRSLQHPQVHQARHAGRLPQARRTSSDVSGDSVHPSSSTSSSVTSAGHRSPADMFRFRPVSARSNDSFPSEIVDDQWTTTSGSYSIHTDDHSGVKRSSLSIGFVQDVYV
ncbi:Protocadherin-9 [Bulinus truncatus]|nr:Protocadherin-9 [Bulinus truncatus]